MMKKLLRFALLLVTVLFTYSAIGQVTTSSMTGRISGNNETLPGATVIAKHVPSGTTYGTVTNEDGRFTIQGMRVGGPYSVDISYVGFHSTRYENINLKLGETYVLNVKLVEDSQDIAGVEIIGTSSLASEKTGASTNISQESITGLPTITREIGDFTRLNPQSNGRGNFAGRDARYNNFTVDGAAFNNNFGLSSGLPGGGSPISIDAIEEISVNISSYDIRNSNFTGANINAVTKSGDNTFKGTVYSFLKPGAFNGNKIDTTEIKGANDAFKQLYGASIGGPIIKDKLFFFLNGEYESEVYPNSGQAWNPRADESVEPSNELLIARTTVSDLQQMKDHLQNTYGYDAGEFQNRPNFKNQSYRILARLDWNINQNNKLTLRYNDVKSTADVSTNRNSAPNPRGSARNSIQSIAFTNSNYIMTNVVRSITGELNSIINNQIANKLLLSYTHIADKRDSNSDEFPFVDIYKDGDQYMSFGYELFTKNNAVINNVANITDNISFYLGNHTVTAGLAFDYLYFKNSYLRYALGYYRYASMEDFFNDAKPLAYGLTYGYNNTDAPGAELSFGYGSLYAQDEWSINELFRLTYGLRIEMPFYLNKLDDNPSNYKEYEFKDGRKIDLAKWPNSKPLFSPRVGFNWDVNGDQSFQVRGGSGLFTGLLPFVWFTNQPTNSGVIQNTVELREDRVPEDFNFSTNYKDVIARYPDLFPNAPSDGLPGSLCFVDPEFKLPQVWRSTLAADVKLPWDMIFTVEGVVSKDVNVVMQQNINELDPSGKIIQGGAERDSWYVKQDDGSWKKNNRIHKEFSYAMMLSNASKGYQYSITAQLEKKFSFGLEGLVAYTHAVSKDLTTNPGSSANSAWSSNTALNSLNDPELSWSNFSIPHRVLGALTYSHNLDKVFGFSISLYYSGSHQDRYSYTYNKDMNGDGVNSDLMYIPKDASEIVFKDVTDKEGNIVMSAADQSAAFMDYIDGDKYLSKHKGEFAQRFGALGPWVNRYDAKVLINLFHDFGTNRNYTLQLSLDFKNVANMFKSTWGVYKTHGLANYNNIRPLKFEGMLDGGETPTPQFTLNASNINSFKNSAKFVNNVTLSNAWSMLLGIRFIF